MLQAAGQMVEVVLNSQWTGRPTPSMYALFKMYLTRLKEFTDVQVAVSSLRLKLMRHEGLFSMENLPRGLEEEEEQLILVLAYRLDPS